MTRLTAYLVRLFSLNALALAGVAIVLIWLIQCLRIFDVVSVKGQGLLTLAGQAFLTMPPLLLVFFYVCVGIGMARALRDLQASQELHAIHSSRRIRALLGAVLAYATLAAGFVLLLSHFLDPYATRRLNDWSASVAADLVSRTLTPHRFSQVTPGVVLVIGGRHGAGQIDHFFADDRRDPEMRRTYVAERAEIAETDSGYIIKLHQGALQYRSADGDFSQIAFNSYDVGMDRLTQPFQDKNSLAEKDSIQIVSEGLAAGALDVESQRKLADRMAEGLRVFGMCVLVAGLAAFPSGRRYRGGLPIEIIVLVIAFVERGFSIYAPVGPVLVPFSGAVLMTLLGLVLLSLKLRLFRFRFSLPLPGHRRQAVA